MMMHERKVLYPVEILMVAAKVVVTLACVLVCDAILVNLVRGVNARWRARSVYGTNDFEITAEKPIEESVGARRSGLMEQAATGPSRQYRDMIAPQVGSPKPALTQRAGAAVFGEAGPNDQAFEARSSGVDWDEED